MTESCTVGHQAVSAVDRDFHFLGQHARGRQATKLNIVEDVHKVKGARLFPRGRFVGIGLKVAGTGGRDGLSGGPMKRY